MSSPRTIGLGLGAVALAGASVAGVYQFTGASSAPSARPPAQVARPNAAVQAMPQDMTVAAAKITRAQVLARAQTWHPHTASRIPYSQSKTYGGYRTDCSGYASMALALPKPGPNTVGLASSTYSTRISMSQLQPGDLVIDATGTSSTRHAVIFVKWTSSAHTAYYEYEQRGSYGTDYRTRTYGLSSGSEYHAYRPKNIA
jgi:cell wall-associated NlpC family hydrolase